MHLKIHLEITIPLSTNEVLIKTIASLNIHSLTYIIYNFLVLSSILVMDEIVVNCLIYGKSTIKNPSSVDMIHTTLT